MPVSSTVPPALILGETGTGKELVARHIHHVSGCTGAFIVVDCGAINPPLAESELFGQEAGAFTGAQESRIGYFEEAHGGTIFLDKIGELALTCCRPMRPAAPAPPAARSRSSRWPRRAWRPRRAALVDVQ
ncbi:hypothetical protein WJ62_28930 [Burkholderia diffusa]|nr:hypothetical protein WJ62_28930 [Burkholderia diffusa]